jgi:hypothetical protein
MPPAAWSLPTRLGFRFAFVYLVLNSFPGILISLPGMSTISIWYDTLCQKAVIWTAAHVLRFSQPLQFNLFASDSLERNIQNLLVVVIATVAMLMWSVLDLKRREHSYLYQWLRLYVRLTLGAALLGYGAIKVIKAQFPDPFLWRLLQPFGDSNPGGLLWTWMGYSKAYNLFTGLVEMAGGALVMVPRLATLGSLLCLGAMTNVFMLNIGYDVTVKLYSLNLLLMAGFLLLPDMQRLGNIFILNRPGEPVVAPPLFRRRWMNAGMLAVQLFVLVYCAGLFLSQAYQTNTQFGDDAPPPPLYGIYAVDEFVVDGQPRPPLFTDDLRWRRFIFDRFNLVGIEPANRPIERYRQNLDLTAKMLQLSKTNGDSKWKASFTVDTPSRGLVTLDGVMDGKRIKAKLRKLDMTFPLYSRGFHWITEIPFNR